MAGNAPGVAGLQGATVPPANINELINAAASVPGNVLAPQATAASEGTVWLGPEFDAYSQKGAYVGSTAGAKNIYSTSQAKTAWFAMTPKQRQEWTNKVAKAIGYRPESVSTERAQSYWNDMVQYAGAYGQAMGRDISPYEMMDKQIEGKKAAGGGGGAGGTRVVVNLTNPADARVLVDKALSDYLGRSATEEESAKFLSVLNQVERANPNVATQSMTSGGTNREQVAKEFGRAQEGAAEFAVASQYASWLVDSVQTDVTEGIASGL